MQSEKKELLKKFKTVIDDVWTNVNKVDKKKVKN